MYSLLTKSCGCLFMVAVLLGCGEALNVNQIFISSDQAESLHALIEKAQIAYDKGKFTDALEYAEKAEKISADNEDIAILLGYINLSLAGMGTFRIADALITASKSSSSSSDDDSSSELIASSTKASDFLATLGELLNLDTESLEKLGTLSSEDDLSKFSAYDVILPFSATDARAADVNVMQKIGAAISKICPFVDEDVRYPDLDDRHSDENCPANSTVKVRSTISNFLWAFVHIAEAVAFYTVVQYQEDGSDNPHIQERADALNEATDLSASSYVTHVVNLAATVDSVYDVGNSDSQFTALVNDINIAAQTFAHIGRMPSKVKKALNKAVSSINDAKDEVSGASDAEQANNSLKSQINSVFADDIQDEIDSYADSGDATDEEIAEMCDAYEDIAGAASTSEACTD